VEHSAGQGFAQLIAGLASKRAEKKAQVIEAQEIKAIEQHKSKYNTYCTTNATQNIATPIPLENEKPFGKARHVRMKRRKPRQKAIDTTTPPAQPPAAI
jgi:DNA-binding protein H-NS